MATDPFEKWMDKVNFALEDEVGIGISDLADWGYRDAFDDEMPPEEAAAEVLKANGWVGEEQ